MRQRKKGEAKLYKNKSIIRFEGKNFLGEVGIDGRIFKALTYAHISVGVISQQAIENGVSVLVNESDSEKAVDCLLTEFSQERKSGKVAQIYSVNNVSVISFQSFDLSKIIKELERNNIFPLLFNQVGAENRINLVVSSSQDEKTKNIVESEIYGTPKTVHLAVIGHGNVGGTLINQVLESREEIKRRKKLDLKIIAVANSQKLLLNKEGVQDEWSDQIQKSQDATSMESLILYAKDNQLENLIAVDNTGSKEFIKNYPLLVENGFDLVSSNKIFNTMPITEYRSLRSLLTKNNKKYLYETNVGAGLPLIDTIKLLHLSGENITRIKGVFSGSLSYIFNRYSSSDVSFSSVLEEAMEQGLTEPDPREDLSGVDVARKLLILARELDLENEFSDIKIQSLLPSSLQKGTKETFIANLKSLDEFYLEKKKSLANGNVLRYVGELKGDLQQDKGELDVRLKEVPAASPLGQLKGSDSLFEIYTESYGDNPIVIMGAGAGAKVTARGVFGDILRISENK